MSLAPSGHSQVFRYLFEYIAADMIPGLFLAATDCLREALERGRLAGRGGHHDDSGAILAPRQDAG